jgi:hypothetical protein
LWSMAARSARRGALLRFAKVKAEAEAEAEAKPMV